MDALGYAEPNANFSPMRIGRRLLVTPAWLDVPPDLDVLSLRIDPGAAFGTGTHPTTRLCLRALERHLMRRQPGVPVIDLGTGTGILAIAAALLGARPVLALDVDPEAVRVARRNVSANGVAEAVRVETGSLAEVLSGGWGLAGAPVVVANILVHVLVDFFANGLAGAVTPGGLLILSGLLRSQTPDIRACLQWHGLTELAQEREEDWVCVLAQRGS